MLLPFHKVYPMQLHGTKDGPNDEENDMLNTGRLTKQELYLTSYFFCVPVGTTFI